MLNLCTTAPRMIEHHKLNVIAMVSSDFNKYILPAIVTGLFLIASLIISYCLNKDDSRLLSREKTETRNADGTITKREMEIYK